MLRKRSRAADHLATGTLADLVRAIQALGVGDLDAAHARVDVVPVQVHTGDELGAMAASLNIMQNNVAQRRDRPGRRTRGLRHARTDLEATHTTLRASEERNRLALQAASMGTWDWTLSATYTHGRPRQKRYLNLRRGHSRGPSPLFQRSIHPDDWPAVEIESPGDDRRAPHSVAIYRTVWPDGSVHWIEGSGHAVYADDGNPCARDRYVDEHHRAQTDRGGAASQ
jgi:PAS domain-containing protein